MSGFHELPTLRPLQDGCWWVLAEPLDYKVNGDSITVPAGFTTDFASTPRFLWWLLPPHGRYSAAAIVHDRLYHVGGLALHPTRTSYVKVYSRAEADRVFLEAMESLGVLLGVRYAMWAAVRLFGWRAWSKNEQERELRYCDLGCDPRCGRVIYPVPRQVRPVRPRGIDRLLHWLHGKAA